MSQIEYDPYRDERLEKQHREQQRLADLKEFLKWLREGINDKNNTGFVIMGRKLIELEKEIKEMEK